MGRHYAQYVPIIRSFGEVEYTGGGRCGWHRWTYVDFTDYPHNFGPLEIMKGPQRVCSRCGRHQIRRQVYPMGWIPIAANDSQHMLRALVKHHEWLLTEEQWKEGWSIKMQTEQELLSISHAVESVESQARYSVHTSTRLESISTSVSTQKNVSHGEWPSVSPPTPSKKYKMRKA
jgi:hypothetical protein